MADIPERPERPAAEAPTSLPLEALEALAATWQKILRARHPEHPGLVVELAPLRDAPDSP